MTYKVERLDMGPRWERIAPQSFERGSAALAWLIDWVRERRPGAVFYTDADPDNPGCYDIMVDYGGAVEQFAVNKEAAR